MANSVLSTLEKLEFFQKLSEFDKQAKITEKIILLVGLENSGKEAFAKYWFGIDILANNRTDAYNQEYTFKDNNTILLFLNLNDSVDIDPYISNYIFVEQWVQKTKKVKIIVCVSIDDLFDKDIYFEILQNELDAIVSTLITYNKKNIGLIVTSGIASTKSFQQNSKDLKDLVLKKLQDQEYQSHFLEVFLHKNEAGAFTNFEIFQYSSSDGSIQNRNQVDWLMSAENKIVFFFSTNGLML
jgi:hypothetical protein